MVLSLAAGLLLFILQIPVPSVVTGALNHMASMNTPLAMIILGTLCRSDELAGASFDKKRLWPCALVRLVLIPAVTLAVFCLIPGIKTDIKLVILIASCTPVGSNIAIFAKQYGGDYKLSRRYRLSQHAALRRDRSGLLHVRGTVPFTGLNLTGRKTAGLGILFLEGGI